MKHLQFETVTRTQLDIGDTIREQEGSLRTVGKLDLLGRNIKLERVLFPKWYMGRVTAYQKQI